ncbi:MAG: VanZ family protein [Rhodothermia bacterium]|nr:VanZ family protein [Rhodothermia bacterium]
MRKARILATAWTILIVAACTIPGRDIPDVDIDFADKFAHFALFFGYGWLWMRAMAAPLRKRLILVGISGVLLSIGTEFYQGLLPWERSPDLYDSIANTAGLAVSVISYSARFKRA